MLVQPSSAFADSSALHYLRRHRPSRLMSEGMRGLVAEELEHRFRNLIAVVDAITRQTLRSSGGASDPATTLSARITALASANDLVRSEPMAASRIGDVVEAALAPLGGNSSGQFNGGGPDMSLDGGLAIALTLVLLELAANALKHGALGVEAGRVSVRWGFIDQGETGFTFCWAESDGPEVQAQKHEGFGLRMIRQALAHRSGLRPSSSATRRALCSPSKPKSRKSHLHRRVTATPNLVT